MAFHSRNKIVTEGLVFGVDAYNTKSYISGDTSVNDLTAGGTGGTIVNGAVFDTNAWVFDGTDEYIDFGEILESTMTGENPAFTVNCWVNVTGTGNRVFFGKFNLTPTQFDFLLWQRSTNTIRVSTNGSTNLVTTPVGSVTQNEWYHVVAVINNTGSTSNTSIYLDGQLSANLTGATSSINENNYPLVFGKTSGGVAAFIGSISSVNIYDRVLTATEVRQNYDVTKWRFE